MTSVIVVTKKELTTRLVIGCEDRAEELARILVRRGYKAVLRHNQELPQRSEEEKTRAVKITKEAHEN